MSTLNSIQEAQLFSEIRTFAYSVENLINLPSVSESTLKLSPALSSHINEYENVLILNENLSKLDREQFRIGIDPFNEWLKENYSALALSYQQLNEGIWDSLKAAGSWVGDKFQALGDTIGQGVKAAGSYLLNSTPWGKKIIAFIKALTEGGSTIGVFQLLLDIIGIIPASFIGIPIDTAADCINAIIYFNRGMTLNGIISLIAALPMGDVIKTLKVTAAKPLKALGDVVRGVAGKDPKAAEQAARVLAKMEGSKSFMEKLSSPIKMLTQGVNTVIKAIVGFLSKFLPASWKAKVEAWLIRNFDAPVRTTKESFELAEKYIADPAYSKLAKADIRNSTNYASNLSRAKGNAAIRDIKVNNINGAAMKTNAIVVNDAAVQAVKKYGYIKPAALDSIVHAGPREVKSLFTSIEQSSHFAKMDAQIQTVVKNIVKDPEVFITASKRAKNLNRSLDQILALVKTGKKRKTVKLATFLLLMLRNYCKDNINCVESYMKGAYRIGNKMQDFILKESFDVDSIKMNPADVIDQNADPLATANTMPQGIKLDSNTKVDRDPCHSVENQVKTMQSTEFIKSFTPEEKFGGTTPMSDTDADQMFDQGVNPVMKLLGAEPIMKSASSEYPMRPITERVKFVEILDEDTMKINIPKDKEEEEARYKKFLENETSKGELTREQIIKIINEQRKKDDDLENTFNAHSNNSSMSTNESRVLSFKNFNISK